MEKIPTVKIEFHDKPYLVMEERAYKENGGWKGFLKDFCMPIWEVKKVHHILMRPQDYPTAEWEG